MSRHPRPRLRHLVATAAAAALALGAVVAAPAVPTAEALAPLPVFTEAGEITVDSQLTYNPTGEQISDLQPIFSAFSLTSHSCPQYLLLAFPLWAVLEESLTSLGLVLTPTPGVGVALRPHYVLASQGVSGLQLVEAGGKPLLAAGYCCAGPLLVGQLVFLPRDAAGGPTSRVRSLLLKNLSLNVG